jgi:hypothetical protein
MNRGRDGKTFAARAGTLRFSFMVTILFASLVGFCGCGNSSQGEAASTTFTSREYGISFELPAGWKRASISDADRMAEISLIALYKRAGKSYLMVMALSTKEGDPRVDLVQTVRGRVRIAAEDDGAEFTPQSFDYLWGHPTYRYLVEEAERGKVIHELAVVGQPYSYIIAAGGMAADDEFLRRTISSVEATLEFSGKAADYSIRPTETVTYEDSAAGFSVSYPMRLSREVTQSDGDSTTVVSLIELDRVTCISDETLNMGSLVSIVATMHPKTLTEKEMLVAVALLSEMDQRTLLDTYGVKDLKLVKVSDIEFGSVGELPGVWFTGITDTDFSLGAFYLVTRRSIVAIHGLAGSNQSVERLGWLRDVIRSVAPL